MHLCLSLCLGVCTRARVYACPHVRVCARVRARACSSYMCGRKDTLAAVRREEWQKGWQWLLQCCGAFPLLRNRHKCALSLLTQTRHSTLMYGRPPPCRISTETHTSSQRLVVGLARPARPPWKAVRNSTNSLPLPAPPGRVNTIGRATRAACDIAPQPPRCWREHCAASCGRWWADSVAAQRPIGSVQCGGKVHGNPARDEP